MENPIQAYLDECCTVAPGGRAWTEFIYDSFTRWLRRHGDEFGMSKQAFVRDLIKLTGAESRVGSNNRKFIQGVQMNGEAYRWTGYRGLGVNHTNLSFPLDWGDPAMKEWKK